MSREIEDRLQAAFAAKTDLVTARDLTPAEPPLDGSTTITRDRAGHRRGLAGRSMPLLVAALVAAVVLGSVAVTALVRSHSNGDTANTTSPSIAVSGLTPAQTAAARAVGTNASCQPTALSNAPRTQTGAIDAGVECDALLAGVEHLYAFHLTAAGATSLSSSVQKMPGAATIRATETSGTVLRGLSAISAGPPPSLLVVWPAALVEVVAVGTTSVPLTRAAFGAELREVSWQYGKFGGQVDFGTGAVLRALPPSLSCTQERLEDMPAEQFQTFLGRVQCTGPSNAPEIKQVYLQQLNSDSALAKSRAENQSSRHMSAFEPRSEDKGCLITGADPINGNTSVYCSFAIAANANGSTKLTDVEMLVNTTWTVAQTRQYFATHSLQPASFGAPL